MRSEKRRLSDPSTGKSTDIVQRNSKTLQRLADNDEINSNPVSRSSAKFAEHPKITSEASAESIERTVSEYLSNQESRNRLNSVSRKSTKSLGTDPESDWVSDSNESLRLRSHPINVSSGLPSSLSIHHVSSFSKNASGSSNQSSSNIRAPNNSLSSMNGSSSMVLNSAFVPPRISSRVLQEKLSQHVSSSRAIESETDSDEELIIDAAPANNGSELQVNSSMSRLSYGQFISIPEPNLAQVSKEAIHLAPLQVKSVQSVSSLRNEQPLRSNIKSNSASHRKVVKWIDSGISPNSMNSSSIDFTDEVAFSQWKAARKAKLDSIFARFDRLHSIIETLSFCDRVNFTDRYH